MGKSMTKRKIGIALIISSIITWLIDGFSPIISTFFGKILCGNRYLQPVEGVVGDVSCGFNADMYLVVFLFAVLLIGIILVLLPRKVKSNADNST